MYMHYNYYIHEQEQFTSFLVFKKAFILKKKKIAICFRGNQRKQFQPHPPNFTTI